MSEEHPQVEVVLERLLPPPFQKRDRRQIRRVGEQQRQQDEDDMQQFAQLRTDRQTSRRSECGLRIGQRHQRGSRTRMRARVVTAQVDSACRLRRCGARPRRTTAPSRIADLYFERSQRARRIESSASATAGRAFDSTGIDRRSGFVRESPHARFAAQQFRRINGERCGIQNRRYGHRRPARRGAIRRVIAQCASGRFGQWRCLPCGRPIVLPRCFRRIRVQVIAACGLRRRCAPVVHEANDCHDKQRTQHDRLGRANVVKRRDDTDGLSVCCDRR